MLARHGAKILPIEKFGDGSCRHADYGVGEEAQHKVLSERSGISYRGCISGFQRLANREKEDGTLTFRMRRKEADHVIVEEG
jgi:hypothetical protein